MKSILLHTSTWGDELYMVGLEDNSKKKLSIGFYLIDHEGKMSEPTIINRSKFFTSKNPYNFVYNYTADFTRDDVLIIKNKILQNLRSIKNVDVSEAVGIDEAYLMLCEYVYNHYVEDSVYIDSNGYCVVETKKLEGILKELECGYKAIQLKRALKIKGVFEISKGRAFDYKLYDKDGNPYWAYRFKNIYVSEDDSND